LKKRGGGRATARAGKARETSLLRQEKRTTSRILIEEEKHHPTKTHQHNFGGKILIAKLRWSVGGGGKREKKKWEANRDQKS